MEDTTKTDGQHCDTELPDSINLKEAARNLGLEQVQAWVPAHPHHPRSNKCSNGADRVRRSREKALGQGSKQLSVTLPIELHGLIKELATRTRSGESVGQVIAELFPSDLGKQAVLHQPSGKGSTMITAPSFPWVDLPFWRRWLISLLLPRKIRAILG